MSQTLTNLATIISNFYCGKSPFILQLQGHPGTTHMTSTGFKQI